MTPSELYAIQFQNPEPAYYTMMPHILDYLTYDDIDESTGQKTIKRLSIYAKELYRALKKVAGEKGACWQNRDNLAEICNMSAGSVTNAKKELSQAFHQLDGNALIKIEKKKKSTENNSTTYDLITIVDIWRWNRAYMSTIEFHKPNPSNLEALSPNDSAGGAPSSHDTAPQRALSPHDINNNPNNKNPLLKEQQPVLLADVCGVFLKKNGLFEDETKRKAYQWLIDLGCHGTTASNIVSQYEPDEIAKASAYTLEMKKKKLQKNEKFDNPLGYFHACLKQKWYDKKEHNAKI